MTKEEVISALEFDNAMMTFNPMTGEDINIETLNKENRMHYEANLYCLNMLNPKPYELKDLKPDMWVWDKKEKWYRNIAIIFNPCTEYRSGSLKAWADSAETNLDFIEFEPNRFYPREVEED